MSPKWILEKALPNGLTSGDLLALSDQNIWYYPMHGHDSDEEELPVALPQGNWGHKNAKGGRWVRRGKITAWGPEMEDWEVLFPLSLFRKVSHQDQ